MRKKYRILKVWFYGYLPLCKRIHKRVIIAAIKERIAGIEHPSTINPYTFEQLCNNNQWEYWPKQLNRKS